MCIAMPMRVIQKLDDDLALVEQDDTVRQINISQVLDVTEGDYVLVNLDVAVQKLSREGAEGIPELWDLVTSSLKDEHLDEIRGKYKQYRQKECCLTPICLDT